MLKINNIKPQRAEEIYIMKVLESKFVQGFIKMANDGYLQGWHERNGGNLSYRLKPEEVEMTRPRLNTP